MTAWVGLTGGIGSGKSTAARLFAQHGVPLIDTDAISRTLTADGGAALPAIRTAFGETVFDVSGSLNRAALRQLVFQSPEAKAKLENILHPLILEAILIQQRQYPQAAYGIIEIPLLAEQPVFQRILQRILVIDCSEETQIRRTTERSGLSHDMITGILAAQAGRQQRRRIADDLIGNEASLPELAAAVERQHLIYQQLFDNRTMSVIITFEHPLSERVRNFLRLEHLFSRFSATRSQPDSWAHHAAIGTLFEIMDCASRAELKLDILQELERQRQQISQNEREQYDATPEQEALYQATQNLQEVQQKFGQHLRENEWLMAIKQRILVSGGTSPFDLPSYHYWLQLPHEQRQADLDCWIRPLAPTGEAIALLLGILRRNSIRLECLARQGNYQNTKLGSNIHMLTIDVGQSHGTLPEISANKYFTHIRFTQATRQNQRGRQITADIPFQLKMCSFDPIADKP